MSNKKGSVNGIHAQRLKDIRPFVDFDYDLTKPLSKSAKAKILRYSRAIDNYRSKPHTVYRPRSEKNKRLAQAAAQQNTRLKGLKVAFIASSGQPGVRVKVNKSGVVVKEKSITRRFIPLDAVRVAVDGKPYITRRLKGVKAKQFAVALEGDKEIPYTASTPALIADAITALEQKYKPTFAKWFGGVNAYSFSRQRDADSYLRQKTAAKKKLKSERAKARRLRKRRYGR